MINAIIVEDEVRGLTNLKSMLKQHCPQVEVIGEAGTLEDAEALVNQLGERINLAFLDINLPDGQIFELLDRIKPLSFNVIFVTAFDQFAIKAFEYASIGYILKPIDPHALAASVERIRPLDNDRLDERLDMFQTTIIRTSTQQKASVLQYQRRSSITKTYLREITFSAYTKVTSSTSIT